MWKIAPAENCTVIRLDWIEWKRSPLTLFKAQLDTPGSTDSAAQWLQGRSQSVVASGIQSGGLEVEGLGGGGGSNSGGRGATLPRDTRKSAVGSKEWTNTDPTPPEPLNKQHFESSDRKEGKTQVLLHLLWSYCTTRGCSVFIFFSNDRSERCGGRGGGGGGEVGGGGGGQESEGGGGERQRESGWGDKS